MVRLDGEKMSKSRGNLVFVSRLRAAGIDPAAIRLAILSHHYRTDWDWTDEGLAQAQERLAAWRAACAAPAAPGATPVLAAGRAHLANDLDAPAALSVIDRWAENTRLRSGASGSEDSHAGGEIKAIVNSLLGVAL